MPPRNVIIFGAPSIDRQFVLKLAGAQPQDVNGPPPARIFETQRHSVVIFNQQYTIHDTVCLNDSKGWSLEAREALGNLYHFTRSLDGGINLLIYVFRDQPSSNDLKLFHDYLCRGDTPIILVMINPADPMTTPDRFPHALVLPLHDAMSESNKVKLRKAITTQLNKNPMVIHHMDRFELTLKESWKLLERAACWSLADCRKALNTTLVEDAFFSEEDAIMKCQDIAEYIKMHYFRNVIVFGDTGAGKTSVIKMLTDKCNFDTTKASSAGASTFKSQAYDFDIGEYHYVFHDTVGLQDATSTSISPEEAIKALYQLITKFEGGISLLVYVHRGKIKPSQVANYKLFAHVICEKEVPTVLVVTGLEQEDSREAWWDANIHLFDAQKIETKYYACITSTKGKFDHRRNEFKYQEEYEESREILKNLFLTAPLINPWKVQKTPRFLKLLVMEAYNFLAEKFKWNPLATNKQLYKKLMAIVEMKEDDAVWDLANDMDHVPPQWKTGGLKTGSRPTLALTLTLSAPVAYSFFN